MSNVMRFAFAMVVTAALSGAAAVAGDPVFLKANEGFDFVKKTVTRKGDTNFDVSLQVGQGRKAEIAAKKIKDLGQGLPDARAFLTIKTWPTSVNAPAPGYYAVQGRDGKSIYLVDLHSFSADGKPSNWEMSFTWEKLQ